MGVLANLEPKSVFYFFEEITKIPHGSGNVGQISDYLAKFAEERGLFCIQDEWKNIIMVKEAAPGYEEEPTVILQGHMDMVAVKKPDCDIDMRTEGLKVLVQGDEISAEGTSLGGDDGIAVAYALALLDAETIKHPRLEVIITVDEEVGMDGARGIDLSMLKGSRMINLDSEEEGIFLTSCAGGARVKCLLPVKAGERKGCAAEILVGGLRGGHSGGEIQKEGGNSNCLFGRLLYRLSREMPVGICEISGGLADNAIPRETKGVLLTEEKDRERFQEIVRTDSGGTCHQGSGIFHPHDREGNRDIPLYGAGRHKARRGISHIPAGRSAGHERGHTGAGGDFPEHGYPEMGGRFPSGGIFRAQQRGEREICTD